MNSHTQIAVRRPLQPDILEHVSRSGDFPRRNGDVLVVSLQATTLEATNGIVGNPPSAPETSKCCQFCAGSTVITTRWYRVSVGLPSSATMRIRRIVPTRWTAGAVNSAWGVRDPLRCACRTSHVPAPGAPPASGSLRIFRLTGGESSPGEGTLLSSTLARITITRTPQRPATPAMRYLAEPGRGWFRQRCPVQTGKIESESVPVLSANESTSIFSVRKMLRYMFDIRLSGCRQWTP